jgi:hypothetical protein
MNVCIDDWICSPFIVLDGPSLSHLHPVSILSCVYPRRGNICYFRSNGSVFIRCCRNVCYLLLWDSHTCKHKDLFTANTKIHEVNTRQKSDFHVPLVSLTKVQKEVYYSGITLFNSLPYNIKQVAHDINRFKHKLRVSYRKLFYSVEEYLIGIGNLILGCPSNYGLVSYLSLIN